MEPGNGLDDVWRLAADESKCEFFKPVLDELARWGLDDDDLREIIRSELGETHCFKSRKTEKYYPETISDYYPVWIDTCGARMFLKILVVDSEARSKRLVVTSFKKDNRFDD